MIHLFTPRYLSKKIRNIRSQKPWMRTFIKDSFITTEKLETVQTSINRRMTRQTVVYFSSIKINNYLPMLRHQWVSKASHWMKTASAKEYLFIVWFHLYKVLHLQTKLEWKKGNGWLPWAGVEEGMTCKAPWGNFWR